MYDDFVALLEAEQRNPNAILLEILGDEYESWDLIIAVEGPDDRFFFYDFIKEALGDRRPKIFECGGKARLIQFRSSAESYQWRTKPEIFYICDKDFDDILGINGAGLFKTGYYSIESYFIGKEFAEYVVDKHCSRALSDGERDQFFEAFCSRFHSLIATLRIVSAAMCEIRASGRHPQFDDFGIEQIFSFQAGSIRRRGRVLSKMQAILSLELPLNYRDVVARARTFNTEDYKSWLRGKLGLQVTKKVYELSRASMSVQIKTKLPMSNHFGTDAFRSAKPFLGQIPGLREYLTA